jgi:hypothetical protein
MIRRMAVVMSFKLFMILLFWLFLYKDTGKIKTLHHGWEKSGRVCFTLYEMEISGLKKPLNVLYEIVVKFEFRRAMAVRKNVLTFNRKNVPDQFSNRGVVLLVLSGCGSSGVPGEPLPEGQKTKRRIIKGQISVGGAYALYPVMASLSADFMLLYPDVRIEIERTTSGEGTQGLIEGKYTLAMISSPLTEEELSAGVWQVPVAKDGVAPIISASNPYFDRIIDRGVDPGEFLKVFTSEQPMVWEIF